MNAKGPRKVMTKDEPDIIALQHAVNEEVAAIAENSKQGRKKDSVEAEQKDKRKILDDVNSWVSSLLNLTYRFVECVPPPAAFPYHLNSVTLDQIPLLRQELPRG